MTEASGNSRAAEVNGKCSEKKYVKRTGGL